MTPIFKYTLISDTQDSLVISEPIGWKQAKVVLERSDLFYSVVELFEGDFIFYGKIGLRNGGIDFLRQCITADGKNAKVNIDVKVSYNYGIRYENLFYGKLD